MENSNSCWGDGREPFFDLTCDPHELHDLVAAPVADGCLANWRDHPEGFVQYSRLVPGRPSGLVIPGSNGKT